MATQDECIKTLLTTSKYDLYYSKKSLKTLLNNIKAFGTITKNAIWKKIFNYLSNSSYCVLKSENGKNEIKTLIELIDDKLVINKSDYIKLISIINYNYKYNDTLNSDLYKYLCERFGICNIQHLSELLKIHTKNKINKFDIYITDFINSQYKEKDNIDNIIYNIEIFMNILMDAELCNSLFDIKNTKYTQNIINFIKTSEIDLDDILYNFYQLNEYITKFIERNNNDGKAKPKKTKAKINDNDTDSIKPPKFNNEQMDNLIKNMVITYINYSHIFLNTIINNIDDINKIDIKNTTKTKKSKNYDTDDDSDDDSDNKNNDDKIKSRISYIDIYNLLYDTKYYIDLKINEKYNWYKYFNINDFEKNKEEYENKLKEKITFLNSDHIAEIDKLNDTKYSEYNYCSSTGPTKENEKNDMFYYELDSDDDDKYEDEDKPEEEVQKLYIAKRKFTFAKYMLNLYGNNVEHINDDNIDKFIKLIHITDFIDLNTALNNNNNKKFLKNIIDNKILEGKSFDKKLLTKIDFDGFTMKYALLNGNIQVVQFLLNNKYSPTQNDFMYIRTKIYGKEDKSSYYDKFADNLELVLKEFAKYNMYMEKDTFIQFCYNNVFHPKFDLNRLKDYTIYKNENDKEFNNIIAKIKQNPLYMTYDNSNDNNNTELIISVQKHINKLNKFNNFIETNNIKESLYKFADIGMRFMLDELLKDYDFVKKNSNLINNSNIINNVNQLEEKPKKIVKKIIKKVVKKKVQTSTKSE